MSSSDYYLAQVNVARMKGNDIDDDIMKEFRENLDTVNALAEASPGFVWRLKDESSNSATEYRPYEDERIIVNLSVWTNLDDLKQFVYKSGHSAFVKRRKEWFESFGKRYMALWWIPKEERPSLADAVGKLDLLNEEGPTPEAFTFQKHFPPTAGPSPSAAEE